MKKYEAPTMEVILFESEDVLNASGGIQLPWVPIE
jgi:hypothetical protein